MKDALEALITAVSTAVAGRVSLPGVLTNFFESRGGHSLILKGPAGTGKTTLALQIVETMARTERTQYISSRVSDVALYAQFPWLAEKNRQRNLLMASMGFLKVLHPKTCGGVQTKLPEALLLAAEKLLMVFNQAETSESALGREELRKLEGQIEAGEADESAEEARGSGTFSGDSITFDVGSDLPEIEVAYDTVEAAQPGKALIVFDSIDALAEKYGISKTRLVNTIQKDVVESGRANVVYVLESHGPTALDYLGDGVISLSTGEHAGRRVRTMKIEKLRGRAIPHPNLNYTLLDGRIRIFEPQRFGEVKTAAHEGRRSPVPDPDGQTVSMGDRDMDALFGGLSKGSVNLVEVGPGIPAEVSSLLAAMIVANFVGQGRGVAHLPGGRGNGFTVRDSFTRHMGLEEFYEHVRVFEMNIIGGEDRLQNVLLVEGAQMDTDFRWDNIEYNLPASKKPMLSLLALDMLERIYGPAWYDGMNSHLFSVRRAEGVFVGMTSGGRSPEILLASSSVHIRLERVGGSVVMYGEKPYTTLHEVVLDSSDGSPRLKFVPIM
ncbi:MAG: gas vesicle protein GvpD P-loop domain-containing protein [Methanobacteriota archaeon]